MFLSVVSAIAIVKEDWQSGQLAMPDRQLYSNLRNSIVQIMDGSTVKAVAVLVDRSGLFVIHQANDSMTTLRARMPDGQTIFLNFVAQDRNSQLAAYLATNPIGSNMTPVTITRVEPRKGTPLLAALPGGAVRGVVARTDGFGVLNNSRRMVPLYEVRFEAAPEQIGGALVFTSRGELLSAVSAALQSSTNNQSSIGGGIANGLRGQQPRILLGPGSLAVAYVPSVELTRRVIDGFKSPNHQVFHPALGLYCVDNFNLGALVQQVIPGSAASEAGIMVNDVIISMGNEKVSNQLDFAKVMFKQQVGSKLRITLRRGAGNVTVNATIGRQID